MSACCPSLPEIASGSSADSQTGIQDHQPVRGENADCFMATANNPTGKHDDATENVKNRIDNTSIPVSASGKVDVTFKMQQFPAGSPGLRIPTDWSMTDSNTGAPVTFVAHPTDPITFTSSGATARLRGTFYGADLEKVFKVIVTASDGTEIDVRGYNFVGVINDAKNNIQLIHPLPGAIITSRFSLERVHPVTKVVKPHFGCDFAFGDKSVANVVAAADGEVVFTGFEDKGAGNYVKINHKNGNGTHLCTTVYMHLAKIFVAVGQKVPAGQAIGLEGNTGIGTGAHLHFECRLPNGTKVDPEPYIRGSVTSAAVTNPDNSADPTSLETKTNDAVLTPEAVQARQTCAPFGPGYPNDQTPVPAPVPTPPSADVFEQAWALTMDTEVIGWSATPPTNPDTLAGLIETKPQRRNCGYVNHPADPGGVTKFGIAQKFNKGISVDQVDYAKSRDAGYTSFWNGKKPSTLATTKPGSAIAVFNFGFLCGLGGVNTILNMANIDSLDDESSIDAICDAARDYLLGKVVADPGKQAFKNGWMARVEKVRMYCKSVL